jgi:hypothetical protein
VVRLRDKNRVKVRVMIIGLQHNRVRASVEVRSQLKLQL